MNEEINKDKTIYIGDAYKGTSRMYVVHLMAKWNIPGKEAERLFLELKEKKIIKPFQ